LQNRNAIVGVSDTLLKLRYVRAKSVGDGQTRGVVSGGVDAVPGRQSGDGFGLKFGVYLKIGLRCQGRYVSLKRKRHASLSFSLDFSGIVPKAGHPRSRALHVEQGDSKFQCFFLKWFIRASTTRAIVPNSTPAELPSIRARFLRYASRN
jgi:hypothetical protein